MQALRCPNCGETRWHILPVALNTTHECVLCGVEMIAERRRPGRGRKKLSAERRITPPGAPGKAGPPPAAPA